MIVQLINISNRFDQAMLKEANEPTRAKPVDIHRSPRDKVNQRLGLLRGTKQTAGTTCQRFVFRQDDRRVADRTSRWQGHRFRVFWALICPNACDFGNDVACAVNADHVTCTHVKALNLTKVMQGDIADGDAADFDRFELTDWRDLSCPSNLPFDCMQARHDCFGREFISRCPARLTR